MDDRYLSVVVVGRNDNYGGDFRQRLEQCIIWTYSQLTLHKIISEIIFVNYNPLSEPRIENFIDWPKSNCFVRIKILTIPKEIHEELLNGGTRKNVPLLEYLAKNAGISRAEGQYVLSMNPDILIDSQIFEKLKKISNNNYYRANRCDYTTEFHISDNVDIYTAIKKDIRAVWYKGRRANVKGLTKFGYYAMWCTRFFENGWKANNVKIKKILNLFSITVYYHNVEFKYHCNASGDFMLMSNENWKKLKGYNEHSYISLHTDSLFVIQAAMLGIGERIFRSPIYHKEHERRFDTDKENDEQRTVYLRYQKEAQQMLRQMEPIIYNDNNWGLRGFDIHEAIL